ncbi:hypothetical protein PI86_03110 [Burkholderia sp. A9]|nr:hypothetical protein PI86_03110 [Burkholderia sp. A9]
MRYHEYAHTTREERYSSRKFLGTFFIQARKWFIQYQDVAFLQQPPGNNQSLALTPRKSAAFFTNDIFKIVRKFMEPNLFKRIGNFFSRDITSAVAKIFSDRLIENNIILRNVANLFQ